MNYVHVHVVNCMNQYMNNQNEEHHYIIVIQLQEQYMKNQNPLNVTDCHKNCFMLLIKWPCSWCDGIQACWRTVNVHTYQDICTHCLRLLKLEELPLGSIFSIEVETVTTNGHSTLLCAFCIYIYCILPGRIKHTACASFIIQYGYCTESCCMDTIKGTAHSCVIISKVPLIPYW